MVSIFLHFLGSRSPPALLFGDSSALNQFNQTKDAPTFYKVRLPTLQNAEDRHCVFSVEADIIINCCFQLLSRRPPLASPSQNLLPHSPLLHPSPPSHPPPPLLRHLRNLRPAQRACGCISVCMESNCAIQVDIDTDEDKDVTRQDVNSLPCCTRFTGCYSHKAVRPLKRTEVMK